MVTPTRNESLRRCLSPCLALFLKSFLVSFTSLLKVTFLMGSSLSVFLLSILLIKLCYKVNLLYFFIVILFICLFIMSSFAPKSRDFIWHDLHSTLAPRIVHVTLEVPGKYFFFRMSGHISSFAYSL